MKGMIIRTAYHNQGWKGKCVNADSDKMLLKCQQVVVNIGDGRFRTDINGNCTSPCDEEYLCSKYKCVFQQHVNKVSDIAFFVYQNEITKDIVLWGMAFVDNVINRTIFFKPFSPLPNPIIYKSYNELLGEFWGSGRYRYIEQDRIRHLYTQITKVNPEIAKSQGD